ncbi:hypothetical protein CCP3SC5AM1_3570002 [Gammaproteobacteria bacterium]
MASWWEKGRPRIPGANPKRDDAKPGSFSINLDTGKWADFATGHHGKDSISLYAYLNNLSQGQAARKLAAEIGESFSIPETKKNNNGEETLVCKQPK